MPLQLKDAAFCSPQPILSFRKEDILFDYQNNIIMWLMEIPLASHCLVNHNGLGSNVCSFFIKVVFYLVLQNQR